MCIDQRREKPRPIKMACQRDSSGCGYISQYSLRRSYALGVILSAGLFAVAMVLALIPALFDAPITIAINRHANCSPLLDFVIFNLYASSLFSGVILVALIWSCWFKTEKVECRARILMGTFLAFPIVSQAAFYNTLFRHIRGRFMILRLDFARRKSAANRH